MSLTQWAFEKQKIIYFLCLIIFVGGIFCYTQLGQLEDPEFTVKTAAIFTQYPGASAKQVELEVTDLLETKIQEMPELKYLYSISRPGLSIIKVDIQDKYWADKLPQVWDNLRKKISDISPQLPPGAKKPSVGDDYGYVFGFLIAITSDGYKYNTLESYAKFLKKELSLTPGVARIDFWGLQQKQVFITVSRSRLTQLGITPQQLQRTLEQQNLVVDAGHLDVQDMRYRIRAGGEFKSPKEIENLIIGDRTHHLTQQKNNRPNQTNNLIRIKDIGDVTMGTVKPPTQMMFFDGKPAIGMAIAPISGVNVVAVGKRLEEKVKRLKASLPVGIEVNEVSWQSTLVDESINDFIINLVEAILIVLAVLALTMGLRAGIMIGVTGLLMPILGTFIIMWLAKIDLQRVSLGAMIIAMGMMVDNAIVVTDGYMVRLQQGVSKMKAAIASASMPAWPLLGATLVACMAFYPIFGSTYSTGEYARSLFQVVAISLLLSWLLSLTVTPLMCIRALKIEPSSDADSTSFSSPFYQKFRSLLRTLLNHRGLFIMGSIGLLGLSIYLFNYVPRMYFPDSSRAQFMIDYWAVEGTRIEDTRKRVQRIEKKLMQDPEVRAVAAFIGQGPPRFYLPVNPEDPYTSYAQLIVNADNMQAVESIMQKLTPWVKENILEDKVRIRKYAVGAFNDWVIEARFSGPAEASPDILRKIAKQALDILNNTPGTLEARTNWRERVRRVDLNYDESRAQWLGILRKDVSDATLRNTDGIQVGMYREKDSLIPIIMRMTAEDKEKASNNLDVIQIRTPLSPDAFPLSQVITKIDSKWEDPIIQRWDRRRAITVQASPESGVTANELRKRILKAFEAIPLPPGYTLEWKGEYDSSKESISALKPGMIPAVAIILFIIIALFNAYRPPLIILLLIPFVMIGISFGLLITQVPFGFIALLGAMSLSGMMVKNAVVLLDQANVNLEEGMSRFDAIIESAVSRLRPVMNATATTVLGMLPLLQDVFWVSMAVTIIFGLAFGSLITMLLLPVFYATFYRLPKLERKK